MSEYGLNIYLEEKKKQKHTFRKEMLIQIQEDGSWPTGAVPHVSRYKVGSYSGIIVTGVRTSP